MKYCLPQEDWNMIISHTSVTDVKEMGKVFTILIPENLLYSQVQSPLLLSVFCFERDEDTR